MSPQMMQQRQSHLISSHKTRAMMSRHHSHEMLPNQCGSSVVQAIDAPLPLVWAFIRHFSNPQAYKQFIKSCQVIAGNGETVGSVREVKVVSGLPAGLSQERLELLDDDMHVMVVSIIGGDHRLSNYRSTMTAHEEEEEEEEENGQSGARKREKTVVIESYVVDVPTENSCEETRTFTETIIGCNLRSLARLAETIASKHK